MTNKSFKAYEVTFSLKRRKGMKKQTQHIIAHGHTEKDAIRSVHMEYNRCNHMPEWRNYRFRIDSITLHTPAACKC